MQTRLLRGLLLAGLVAGLGTVASAQTVARAPDAAEPPVIETPEVVYPSPPVETLVAEEPAPGLVVVPAPTEPAPVQPPAPAPPVATPPATPPEPSEAEVVAALVADLARYANLAGDDLRREIGTVTTLLGRQRTDANRVRLAMLYTLTRSPQDDQRALQLLDVVAKANPGSPAIKALAGVIQIQIVERLRAVREEQQKADAAIQKLEALRVLERSLLRDRLRSGGGGAGGGSAGGGGGGGGR